MKKVLFISRSKLSHNLLRAILPLAPVKTDMDCLEGVEEVSRIPKRGKRYDLLLADWNSFSSLKDPLQGVSELEKHPLTKGAKKILLHPLAWAGLRGLSEAGFSFRAKPFLPEDLAHIIGEKI
ncbi:MAG: hypothetical protein Q7T11_00650 [Deltaproteobacteria bacterium]|nr:hypothetical protein [Deltaproteobacteria bacterium]